MPQAFDFDPTKFREAIIYFANECEDDFWFGSTRLNKQLFVLDFLAYTCLGKPITGATYMHEDRGPIPRELLPQRRQLLESGELELEDRTIAPDRTQQRPIAIRCADMQVFTEPEASLLKSVASSFRNITANRASEWSHGFVGWQLTVKGEDIPYFTAFIGDSDELTRGDIEWGQRAAATHYGGQSAS